MVSERRTNHYPTTADDTNISECAAEFVYLASLITKSNNCCAEIKRKINLASQKNWNVKDIDCQHQH